MRFLIDENLPVWLAGDLRGQGTDALDVREVGRPGLPDDAVYGLARRLRRHLVTANYKDFGNPLLYPPTPHVGIIVIRMPKSSVRTVAGHVSRYIMGLRSGDIEGCLIVLESTRVRRRRLA